MPWDGNNIHWVVGDSAQGARTRRRVEPQGMHQQMLSAAGTYVNIHAPAVPRRARPHSRHMVRRTLLYDTGDYRSFNVRMTLTLKFVTSLPSTVRIISPVSSTEKAGVPAKHRRTSSTCAVHRLGRNRGRARM